MAIIVFKPNILFLYLIIIFIKVKSSIINIKVNGTGRQQIINSQNDGFNIIPNKIYVNDILQNYTGFYVEDLTNDINYITIEWNDETKIYNFHKMFYKLENIIAVDLIDIKSNSVSNTIQMFRGCKNLISISFGEFNTSSIADMSQMFDGCENLVYLNLNNFDASSCTSMWRIFYNCNSLISLNLNNIKLKSNAHLSTFFNSNKESLIMCYNTEAASILDNYYSSYTNDCDKICNQDKYYFCYDNKKCPENYEYLINEKKLCIKKCEYDDLYKYEYNNKCYKKCPPKTKETNYKCKFLSCDNFYNFEQNGCLSIIPEGYYLNNTNSKTIDKCSSNCKTCSGESNICLSCYNGYYLKNFNCKECNQGNYYFCYNGTKCPYEYEYLINDNNICIKNCKFDDLYNNKFEYNNKCYKECPRQTKIIDSISNKCIFDKDYIKYIPEKKIYVKNCSEDDIYLYEFNYTCYNKCPNDTIISANIPFYCELKCPKERSYEIIDAQICVSYCSIEDRLKNKCRINYKDKNEEIKIDLSSKIIEEILNGNLNELLEIIRNNKTDFIYEEKDAIHQIASLKNQEGKLNLSSINFGECENLFRTIYNISVEEDFLIYKVENKIKGFNIPIIEYSLFTPNGSINLDLNLCKNIRIQYDIPVSINNSEIDKYDPNSDYYNDECKKYSTDEKLDKTLYDRKNEYNYYNLSLCESKCIFKEYNISNSKAICDCNIKSEMTYAKNGNKDDLLNKIPNEKANSNFGVLKCVNAFISPERIKSNSSFFLLLIILVIFIIVFILFCIKGRNTFEEKTDEVINKRFKNSKTDLRRKKKAKTDINKKIKNKNKNKNKKKIIKGNRFKKKIKSKQFPNDILNTKKDSKSHFKKDKNIKSIKLPTNKNNNLNDNNDNIKPDNDNDYELNTLSYMDAIKYDKRSCCEYYMSLIKNKQIITFTFCSFNDYNSGIIKKFIFFLSFALHYTINALFFNDSNLHQIYEDKGKYNFSYQFPKILISAVSSTIILRIILETLVLTDKSILKIKYQKTYILAVDMKNKILKYINIKLAIFFILNFILLVLFWFYLTCICDTYNNTQIYLIENTAISFGISLFYPFIINIIPASLRICSLGGNKNDNSCLYNFSKFMQLL